MYYVRAYATNSIGTSYGSQLEFTTLMAPPTNGLVAYYPFNGNANDESGNSNHGTVYGPILTSDRFGATNQAYDFDGNNDYIVSNSVLPIGNSIRSISVWFNTPSASGSNGWYVNTITSWGDYSGQCVQRFWSILYNPKRD